MNSRFCRLYWLWNYRETYVHQSIDRTIWAVFFRRRVLSFSSTYCSYLNDLLTFFFTLYHVENFRGSFSWSHSIEFTQYTLHIIRFGFAQCFMVIFANKVFIISLILGTLNRFCSEDVACLLFELFCVKLFCARAHAWNNYSWCSYLVSTTGRLALCRWFVNFSHHQSVCNPLFFFSFNP